MTFHSAIPPLFRQLSAVSPGGGERERRFYSAVSFLPIGGGGIDGREAPSRKPSQSASNPPTSTLPTHTWRELSEASRVARAFANPPLRTDRGIEP